MRSTRSCPAKTDTRAAGCTESSARALSGNSDKICLAIDDPAVPRGAEFTRRFESLRSVNHDWHSGPYQTYFAQPPRNAIGFCIVRANASGDLLARLEACESHLAENAVVLIENCNRAEIRNAGLQFLRSSRNQYRVLLDRRTPHHGA